METIISFFKSYFREVCSCIATLAFAATIAIASFNCLNAVSIAMMLMVFFAVFVLNTIFCAKRCNKIADFNALRVCVFICEVLIFSVFIYRYSTPTIDKTQISTVAAIAVITCLISDGVIIAKWRKLLEKSDPDAYIRLLVTEGGSIKEHQQMRLLDPSMERWLYQYTKGHYLCHECERKLFTEPHPDYIRTLYIRRYRLNDETQEGIFHLPDAVAWFKLCIENHMMLSNDSIEKIFKLPEAPQLIGMYIQIGAVLDDKFEMRLFDLPNGKELYLLYRQKYIPCGAAELRAKELSWI